jgi:nucleoid DNA-binding protein
MEENMKETINRRKSCSTLQRSIILVGFGLFIFVERGPRPHRDVRNPHRHKWFSATGVQF